MLEYGVNDYLLPLNDFLSQNPDIDSAIPDAIKNCYAGENGEIYGLAYTSLVTGFYYNKQIFAENGLSEPTNEKMCIRDRCSRGKSRTCPASR